MFYHAKLFAIQTINNIMPEVKRYFTFEPSITSVPLVEQALFFCIIIYLSVQCTYISKWVCSRLYIELDNVELCLKLIDTDPFPKGILIRIKSSILLYCFFVVPFCHRCQFISLKLQLVSF